MNPKIAIAVSTYNRKATFLRWCHNMWLNHPEGCAVFIVDAGSDENYAITADYKFDHRATISEVKNKCLQLCYDSGADHIFLFDDDTFPIHIDWWKPYVECKEHHLCYTFLPSSGIFKKEWVVPVNLDDEIKRPDYQIKMEYRQAVLKSHLLGNGCMLYFTRHCIETVGGFDTRYVNKYEHCDLSRRIYNARLTDNIYQDVAHSGKMIYCLDQDSKIQRSFTNREMQDNLKAGYEYFRSREDSSEYIEFRT